MNNRAKPGMQPRKVTVNKTDLLTKLTENKSKHIREYNSAVAEYKKLAQLELKDKQEKIVGALQKLLEKVKSSEGPVTLVIDEDLFFDLNPPVSHEEDYNEIIEMVKWEVEDKIELDSIEFTQYVMDNWAWKEELKNTRTFYASKQIGYGIG